MTPRPWLRGTPRVRLPCSPYGGLEPRVGSGPARTGTRGGSVYLCGPLGTPAHGSYLCPTGPIRAGTVGEGANHAARCHHGEDHPSHARIAARGLDRGLDLPGAHLGG